MTTLKDLIRTTRWYKTYKVAKTARETMRWQDDDNKRLSFYSTFIKSRDICFDIGANIGNRTKIFLKIVGPDGKVVSVEPQDFCMKVLKNAFAGHPNVYLENTALGEAPGEAEIAISNETTVSSMSSEWIESVKNSKRFGSEIEWNQRQKVRITTLDHLIERHGEPNFIKIDVEGYEKEVLSGLSRKISTCFSLEFTPEFLDSTFDCLNHLTKLGAITCNYSIGESMSLKLEKWVSAEEIRDALLHYENDPRFFGDIYIRLNI